jgi:hypothetical protein
MRTEPFALVGAYLHRHLIYLLHTSGLNLTMKVANLGVALM